MMFLAKMKCIQSKRRPHLSRTRFCMSESNGQFGKSAILVYVVQALGGVNVGATGQTQTSEEHFNPPARERRSV